MKDSPGACARNASEAETASRSATAPAPAIRNTRFRGRLLAERNLHESGEGPVWMTDPRLRGASAVKLTEGQIQSVLRALGMPTLLMLAAGTPARYREVADWASRYIKHLTVVEIAGGHHFHMEEPAAEVALRLWEFLSETEERECA